MTIYINYVREKNLYDNTHDYAEYSDFYYDFQNLVFFGIFPLKFYCIGFDDIERDIKRRPFSMKTREFGDPPGVNCGHPRKFHL